MLRSKANRGNSFQRFRDAVTETLRQYKIQIDSAILTGLLSCIWRCMSDTQKEHYRRPDVRVQAPRDSRVYDRIAQDREWQPILQELGQCIIDLHACQCKADAPSSCFDGTCTTTLMRYVTSFPTFIAFGATTSTRAKSVRLMIGQTEAHQPRQVQALAMLSRSCLSIRTEATVVVTPNVPSQLDISEFYTLMQDPGQF
jgi:hypothetical protein